MIQKKTMVNSKVQYHLIYNLREACEHVGTVVKSTIYIQYIALRPNHPWIYSNQTNA